MQRTLSISDEQPLVVRRRRKSEQPRWHSVDLPTEQATQAAESGGRGEGEGEAEGGVQVPVTRGRAASVAVTGAKKMIALDADDYIMKKTTKYKEEGDTATSSSNASSSASSNAEAAYEQPPLPRSPLASSSSSSPSPHKQKKLRKRGASLSASSSAVATVSPHLNKKATGSDSEKKEDASSDSSSPSDATSDGQQRQRKGEPSRQQSELNMAKQRKKQLQLSKSHSMNQVPRLDRKTETSSSPVSASASPDKKRSEKQPQQSPQPKSSSSLSPAASPSSPSYSGSGRGSRSSASATHSIKSKTRSRVNSLWSNDKELKEGKLEHLRSAGNECLANIYSYIHVDIEARLKKNYYQAREYRQLLEARKKRESEAEEEEEEMICTNEDEEANAKEALAAIHAQNERCYASMQDIKCFIERFSSSSADSPTSTPTSAKPELQRLREELDGKLHVLGRIDEEGEDEAVAEEKRERSTENGGEEHSSTSPSGEKKRKNSGSGNNSPTAKSKKDKEKQRKRKGSKEKDESESEQKPPVELPQHQDRHRHEDNIKDDEKERRLEERRGLSQVVNAAPILEVKCKLGSIQRQLEETESVGIAFFLVQCLRSLEQYIVLQKAKAAMTNHNLNSSTNGHTQRNNNSSNTGSNNAAAGSGRSSLSSSPRNADPRLSTSLNLSSIHDSGSSNPVSPSSPNGSSGRGGGSKKSGSETAATSPKFALPLNALTNSSSTFPLNMINLLDATRSAAGLRLSTRQKDLKLRYMELLDSIEQAISEMAHLIKEVRNVLTIQDKQPKSAHSIVSYASIVKDVKKIWDSETGYYEYEQNENSNFIYVAEKLQQLAKDVEIPDEQLKSFVTVTLMTIEELLSDFDEKMQQVVDSQSITEAISLARKLRSIRKFLLSDTKSSDVVSSLNRSSKEGVGGQIMRLQALLKKEDANSELIEEEEKALQEMTSQITTTNNQRHILSMAIRNLDRKINLIVKSRKMQIEDEAVEREYEEVFQFFDTSKHQENPLGANKAKYEAFVSILRSNPKYIANLIRHLSLEQSDSLVHTITFSMFSDLCLGTEEAQLLNMIATIMRSEFHRTKAPTDFLRGTTFVTNLLAGYTMRQSGRLHLIQTLRDAVLGVVEDKELSLELDPQKLLIETGIAKSDVYSMEIADIRKMPEIKAKIRLHQTRLHELGKQFLGIIVKSLPTMPFGMRWLAKQLQEMLRARCPAATQQENDILIGSYIFLRFYSPAIIAPEAHGILVGNTVPSPRSRRNLLHIAKVLQNLANQVSFGAKEPFMVPMNMFLKDNLRVLSTYFENLTNVGEQSSDDEEQAATTTQTKKEDEDGTSNSSNGDAVEGETKQEQKQEQEQVQKIDINEDPLAVLVRDMLPVPSLLPLRENKYMLLNVQNAQESEEERVESPRSRALTELKEKLWKVLCMIAPLEDILDEGSEDEDEEEQDVEEKGKEAQEDRGEGGHNQNEATVTEMEEADEEEGNEINDDEGDENPSTAKSENGTKNESVPKDGADQDQEDKGKDLEEDSATKETSKKPSWATKNILEMLLAVKAKMESQEWVMFKRRSITAGVRSQSGSSPHAEEVLSLISQTVKELQELDPIYQEDNYAALLRSLEQDYQRRRIYLSFLCTEKIEMLQSLEHLRTEVDKLFEEKRLYSEYLHNVQLKAFLARIKSKAIIGPFKYKIKDLMKLGVVLNAQPPPLSAADFLQQGPRKRRSGSLPLHLQPPSLAPGDGSGSNSSLPYTLSSTELSDYDYDSEVEQRLKSKKKQKKSKARASTSTTAITTEQKRSQLSLSSRFSLRRLTGNSPQQPKRRKDNDEDPDSSFYTESETETETDVDEAYNTPRGRRHSLSALEEAASSSPLSSSCSSTPPPKISTSSLIKRAPIGIIKMSCTSPGCVNLVIHYQDYRPQFFEVQLSKLMDELLTRDTVCYNGVVFDLRKVIHFINQKLTG
ncbi:Ras GTPase activating protein ira2 [Balamuthia mandrillaris]